MRKLDPDSLDADRLAVVSSAADGSATIDDIRRAFADPAEAFICSPVPLSMRQLVRMYMDDVPDEDRHGLPRELRRRARDERWREQRAVFQARRMAARRDAILQSEAEVWAIVGLEFHSLRIRRLWERWEALDAYVMDGIERLEASETVFTTALRDACRELRDIEAELMDVMPKLGIPDRAQQFWTNKAGSRAEMIDRIEERLSSVAGGEKAGKVFELIDGGTAEEGA